MEAMANEVEASKILRMRRELSESRDLTSVTDDCTLFEVATNSQFNQHMNEIVRQENEKCNKIRTNSDAKRAIENIRVMLTGQDSPDSSVIL